MKIFGNELKVTAENTRLWMGAIGMGVCLFVFVLTCIFGYNGEPQHIELTKYLMGISAGLLGISVLKEGVNFNIGNSKSNEKTKEENDRSGNTK